MGCDPISNLMTADGGLWTLGRVSEKVFCLIEYCALLI